MRRKDRIYLISIFFILLTLVVGFYMLGRNRIRYTKNTSTEIIEPPVSVLSFPVYLSVSDLEQLANQKLKMLLLNKRQLMANKKDSLNIKVERIGDLKFQLENEKLYASIPLTVEVFLIKKIGKKHVHLFKKNPIKFDLSIHARATFDLNSDIKIDAKTTITQLEWKKEPNLKIAGIDFNIKELVEKNITEQLPGLTKQLNSIIREKVNLRKTIDKIWTKLQFGKVVDKEEKSFFVKIQPQSLAVHVDKTGKDSLRLNLIVESKIYLRHSLDTAIIKNNPLPQKVKILDVFEKEKINRAHLHALLPITVINEKISLKLKGKKLEAKGMIVTIKSLELTTGEDCFIGVVEVAGDLKGKIKIKGMPVFSKEKNTITFDKIDVESQLDDELMNTVAGIFIDEIKKLLNLHSTIQIEEYFVKIPELARAEIEKSKLAKKATVTLNDLVIKNVELFLKQDNVQLLIEVSPDFEIALKKEGLKLKSKNE